MAGKIVITGGSGFIGTNALEQLVSRGWTVLNLDIRPPRNPLYRANWERVDILEGARLSRAVREFSPEVVLHLAARTDLEGRTIDDYSANTQGVANLLEACRSVGSIERVIAASSMLVCKLGYISRITRRRTC